MRPAVLILAGQSILSTPGTSAATTVVPAKARPTYHISWSVTSIPQKGSSVVFERVEEEQGKTESAATTIADHNEAEKEIDGSGMASADSQQQKRQHLFYLAHPAGAQFQTDTPAYYLTTVLPMEMLGNIILEPTALSSGVHFPGKKRPAFKALLHAGKSSRDAPLFDDKKDSLPPLFAATPISRAKRWMGKGGNTNGSHRCSYTWTDSEGKQVAYEEEGAGKGAQRQHKLIVTAPMERAKRDALVALWCLRLWHDTAESKEARRDAIERWTPPESAWGYTGNDKMAKRGNALTGFAAGGGAGC